MLVSRCFIFFKQVDSLILKVGSFAEQVRTQEDANKATEPLITIDCTRMCTLETQAQETFMTSACVQTISTKYFGKNKSTQTKANCISTPWQQKVHAKSKGRINVDAN